MDWKEFFWASKEKVLIALGLFVLLNVLFFPVVENALCEPCPDAPCFCPQFTSFVGILGFLNGRGFVSVDWAYEIVFLGFSYLAVCIGVHMMKKKGERK